MEYDYKEGAARPLYSSAPQNRPAALPAPFRPLPGSPLLWGAAAVLSYPLAWYYTKYVLMGSLRGAACTVFTLMFVLGVELFSRALGRKGSRETWFWAACWLAQSVALSVYGLHADVLQIWQMLVWHPTAVYFVLCRTGMQAAGKANAMVAVDGLVGVFVLPWTGILLRLRSLWAGARACLKGRVRSRRRLAEVLAGVVLALVLAWYAALQLSAADAAFARLVEGLLDPLRWQWDGVELVYLICSIPVGMWLFGLVGGGLQRTEPPVTESVFYRSLGLLPRLPAVTANLAVGALCAVYLLFFGVQCAEFAAALGAPSPLEAVEASRFAVEGFWELCRVLVLDFAVLAALHFLSPAPVDRPGRRRILLTVFCAFGLGFVGLAAAKLGVYIRLWGLTPRRIISAWCLVVLGLAAVLALARLWRKLQAVRIWVLAGMVSFCVLCAADVEKICVQDHMDRLLAGTAGEIDWNLLEDCLGGRPDLAHWVQEKAGNLSDRQQQDLDSYFGIWQ